jgi:L-ascorbate 6-phosphate lactonase
MERIINAKVEAGRIAIHWLGQGGFAFKNHAGDVLVVDPYLSDSANSDGGAARLVEIPVRPKDVRLDYLFLTHDHTDHTDPQTAPVIAQNNPTAPIVCPPSSAQHLTKLGIRGTQIQTAMPGQSLEFPNFKAHVIPARHTEDSVGYLFEFNEANSETDNVAIYITGDTEYDEMLAAAVEEYGPDVLLVPINGRLGNMDAAQAARLTAEIAPREVIPMHFGMFADNTADPKEFLARLSDDAQELITPVVMKHNTCHIFCPPKAAQGRQAQKHARAERAWQGRTGGEHHDGIRGPNGGSGITRGGGRTR